MSLPSIVSPVRSAARFLDPNATLAQFQSETPARAAWVHGVNGRLTGNPVAPREWLVWTAQESAWLAEPASAWARSVLLAGYI